MNRFFCLLITLFLIVSCNENEKYVRTDTFEPFSLSQVKLASNVGEVLSESYEITGIDSMLSETDSRNNLGREINDLTDSINSFRRVRELATLENCKAMWRKLNESEKQERLSQSVGWIKLNAELLLITGETKFATILEESMKSIENRNLNDKKEVVTEIFPVIFTKDVDNVYVNLFTISELNFRHSFGGNVKIVQDIINNENGVVDLKFSMDAKRYMEIYIRIPDWAENPEVVVKKVKYFALPGNYCKIAKKWKEGDVVEIKLKTN